MKKSVQYQEEKETIAHKNWGATPITRAVFVPGYSLRIKSLLLYKNGVGIIPANREGKGIHMRVSGIRTIHQNRYSPVCHTRVHCLHIMPGHMSPGASLWESHNNARLFELPQHWKKGLKHKTLPLRHPHSVTRVCRYLMQQDQSPAVGSRFWRHWAHHSFV